MELIITEKPNVAKSIAKIVGATERHEGYLKGNEMIVSWCIGHLVELAPPAAYNKQFVHWRYKDLPIIPEKWQYNVTDKTSKQFIVLSKLMKEERVTGIICATDAGR